MFTPVHRVSKSIYLKLECLNLGNSHKVRAARQMIQDAEYSGLIRPNQEVIIIEKTGGNLGIGLAIEANRRGYDLELVIPKGFSEHKKKILQQYGAKLVGQKEIDSGVTAADVVQKIVDKSDKHVFLDQFKNKSNIRAHRYGTGFELVSYLIDNVGAFNSNITLVGGAGTGASLTGVGLALKNAFRNVNIIAVQPENCDIKNGLFVDHKLQGIAVGVIPPFLDFDLIDEIRSCTYEQAKKSQYWLVKNHGIFGGLSSGANVFVARQIEDEYKGKKNKHIVVSLIYDSGESYLN